MQSTLLVLALSAAMNPVFALPSGSGGHLHARHAHQHMHRHQAKRNYDLSNVDWNKALENVNWNSVKYGANQAATPVAAGTTTVTPAATTPTSNQIASQAQETVESNNQVQTSSNATPATSTTSSNAQATSSTAASGDEYTITVVNNCASTIWQAGWQANTNGALISDAVKGNEMAAGATLNLAIPKKALGLQIWARQGCTGSGSSFTCSVGDCQGFQCTSIIWQDGPILAEFGAGLCTTEYNTDITAYDISAIPGNNVGAQIVPSKSSCETKTCPQSGCSTTEAWQSASDINLGSPADTTCSDDTNFTVTFCPSS